MKFSIITIFPEAFDSYLNSSILKRARKRGLIKINFFNPRDYVKDRSRSHSDRGSLTKWSGHKTVDDKPFGGGAGMVMKAEPMLKAVSAALRNSKSKTKIILLSAKGKQFNQKTAFNWAKKYKNMVLISGRYEGIDERVRLATKGEEISVGPYVLTDGDVGSMVIISAVSRLLPGVIKFESVAEESFWGGLLKNESKDTSLRLEYPHYTRPEILNYKSKKYTVPKVLLSGNHKKIRDWREKHKKLTN